MFSKVIKNIPAFFIYLVAIAVTLVVSIYSVVRSPSVQEVAGRIAARWLSDRVHTEVRLAGIRISDMLMVQITGLRIDDPQGVPIFNAESLFLRIDDLNPSRHKIDFKKVWLNEAQVNLRINRGDSNLNIIRVLEPLLKAGKPDTTAVSAPWTFRCDELLLSSVSFSYRDENADTVGSGMDYADLAFEDIYLSASDIAVAEDSIQANIHELTCREQCGMELGQFSGLATVSSRGIRVRDLVAVTGKSNVRMDLEFSYHGYGAFSQFIDSVRIKADISESTFNLKDVSCFAPILERMDNQISVKGRIEGTVSDFRAEDLWFMTGLETEFSGDITMQGLPDIYNTYADINFRSFYVNPDDLNRFALPIDDGYIQLPEIFDSIGTVNIRGFYRGRYNDFSTDLEIASLLGRVNMQLLMNGGENLTDAVYSGSIASESFDLGGLLKGPDFGLVSLEAGIEGRNIEPEKLSVKLDAAISGFDYRDQLYEGIGINGEFTLSSFNGELRVDDDALKLYLKGLVDFSPDQPRFDLFARVDRALLYQMKIADRSPDMNLNFSVDAEFSGLEPKNFKGGVVVKNLRYTENGEEYHLGHFNLVKGNDLSGEQFISLDSDYLYGELTGDFRIDELPDALARYLLGADTTASSPATEPTTPQQVSFNLIFKDMSILSELFYPGIEIGQGSSISGEFDEARDIFDLEGSFGYILLFGMTFEDLRMRAEVQDGLIGTYLTSHRLVFKRGETGQVGDTLNLENLELYAALGADSIPFRLGWDDFEAEDFTTGTIEGFIRITEKGTMVASISHADARIYGQPWRILPGNEVTVDSSHLLVRDLVIESKDQKLWVDGGISRASGDTLAISFSHWMLDNFRSLLPAELSDIHGMVNGEIGISLKGKVNNIFLDLGVEDLVFNGAELGTGFVGTSWNHSEQSMDVKAELYNEGTRGRYKVVDLHGLYYPFDKTRNFDMVLSTQNLRLTAVEPFLSSFSSHFDGLSSGRIEIRGSMEKPELQGRMRVQRGEIKIDYTNVTYSFSHEVIVDKDRIWFKDLELYDIHSNKAICEGSLTHRYFRDMVLDLKIVPDNVLAMDLSRYDNNMFYGQAFASGQVRIYGPFDDLVLDIDASTEKGTDFFIPINYYVDVSQSDFILFETEADTVVEKPDYKVYVKGFRMNFKVRVTPDASVQIFLPSNMGYIMAKGSGTLRMGMDPRGYMTLDGTYYISDGTFYFTFEQLVSRRFDISEGSLISWDGDIYEAEVDIRARYRTKTSLSGLGLTMLDPSTSSQKVNVVCVITMQEKLFDPTLKFSFEFPNMNEQTRQTVYAVLDTTNMAMMNQQAISLLVLNSFSQAGAGGNINSAAFLSNSLSSLLSQVSKDFDIGINYMPGDNVNNEEIGVALSTQLFNERLSIDGNIGVTSDESSTQKTSSIVGDVNIEYKLTADGRFRVKAFNRPNDVTVLEDYAPSTQGIGIFYRKEFNRVGELFRKKEK